MRLAGSGAGAAAIACLDLLVAIGLKREKITICDSKGVVHRGRQDLDADKARYATDTSARTLADAMQGADVFLGLSQGGLVKPDMVKSLAAKPLILALANPESEIRQQGLGLHPNGLVFDRLFIQLGLDGVEKRAIDCSPLRTSPLKATSPI